MNATKPVLPTAWFNP